MTSYNVHSLFGRPIAEQWAAAVASKPELVTELLRFKRRETAEVITYEIGE